MGNTLSRVEPLQLQPLRKTQKASRRTAKMPRTHKEIFCGLQDLLQQDGLRRRVLASAFSFFPGLFRLRHSHEQQSGRYIKGFPLISKFFCLCFLLPLLSASANGDDRERVSFSMHNAPLKAALQEITKQTQINFIYANREVDSIKVDCQFSKTPVAEAVRLLLHNTPLVCKRTKKKQMVIFRQESVQGANISGVVVDAGSREALPFVDVWSKNSNRVASTDGEGRFFLPHFQSFPCTLQVSHVGYSPQTLILHEPEASEDLRVSLRQNPFVAPAVTISADHWEAFEVPTAPSQLAISPKHFSDLPIIGDKDLSRSLQLMPGIVTSHYGASGLHVRGGLPSENLVLLDGMTLYHMNHAFGFFNAFNAEVIKGVRLYKGNIPAKFGGRISAVMDLAAKTGDFQRVRASVGMNPMSSQAVLEIPLFSKGALLLSGRRSFSKFILSSLYDRVFRRLFHDVSPTQVDLAKVNYSPQPDSNPEIDFNDMLAKATIMPTRNDVLTLSFYTGFDRVESVEDQIVLDSLSAFKEGNSYRQYSKWESIGWSTKWHRQWGENLRSTALLTSSHYSTQHALEQNPLERRTPEGPPTVMPGRESDSENDIEDFSVRVDNQWQLDDRHALDFGLSRLKSNLLFESISYFYNDTGLQKIPDSSVVSATLISAYAEHAWQPSAKSSLRFGLRANQYEVSDSPGFSKPMATWEPRLSIEHRFSEILALKSAWNRHYQFILQFGDDLPVADVENSFSWIWSDRARVQPSFSEHLVLGAQVGQPDFFVDVEFYRKNLDHVFGNFDNRQFARKDTMSNALTQYPGYASGLDVLLQKKAGGFTGWLSYSWSRTRIRLEREGTSFSVPSTQDTPDNLKLVGSLARGNWHFSGSWQYLSGRPYSIPEVAPYPELGESGYILLAPPVPNTKRLPATHRLDVSVTRTFSHRFFQGKIGVSVFNLYDRQNVWYRYFTIRNGELTPVDVHAFGTTPTFFVELRW